MPPLAIMSACSATDLRRSKPSAMSGSKRVPAYIPESRPICRSSNDGRPVPLSDTFGTTTRPVITMGNPSVNATGAAVPSSEAARRLRNPDPYACGAEPGAETGMPLSMLSCVSK